MGDVPKGFVRCARCAGTGWKAARSSGDRHYCPVCLGQGYVAAGSSNWLARILIVIAVVLIVGLLVGGSLGPIQMIRHYFQ